MKQFLLPVLEVLEVLAIVLISIYIVYGFIAEPFLVQGASMEPNFSNGDYLLVDEITYQFRIPSRGEVIVFRNPNNQAEFYIKRIIGLPGEQIIVSNGNILVDGELLDEDYLKSGVEIEGEQVIQLGDNEYYVMGDNRPHSSDSRKWGPLDKDLIIGVARLRFWPPATFGILTF